VSDATLTRRGFLVVGSAAGAGLLIGIQLSGCKKKGSKPTPPGEVPAKPAGPAPLAPQTEVTAWVRIGTDDVVSFMVPEAEMGQGVLTSFPMILADELDADWTKVRSEQAPADEARYGPQSTGGSTSIRTGFERVRVAGATARAMLVGAAAARWQVDAAACTVRDGVVSHAASKQSARFGELAEDAAKQPVPEQPALKDPKEFRIVGTPAKRLDIPAKVDGTAVFGIDIEQPGMLIAQVEHCPIFGGALGSVNSAAAEAVDGVRKVLTIPTGVAVVADHFWAARKGREALEVTWDARGSDKLSSASILAMCKAAAGKGAVARSDGDVRKALGRAKQRIDAVYDVPYLAHAPMEPLSCTAIITADRCEVWTSTQSPGRARTLAAEISGLDEGKVTLHTALLGGGFGRRSHSDFVADALHIARAMPGTPIKLVWSREDDIRGGFYRPMAYNELSGGLDAEGWPVAWEHRIASPAILSAFGPLENGIDRTSVEGASNLPYAIADQRVTYANVEVPISTWFWRSVGSSQNAFVTECFLDELAAAGGKDPVEVRRRLLKNAPRHARVLEAAVEKAGWGTPLPEGRARGVAVHESFGSFVAQVAEVSIDGDRVRVHRVVCAVDCGQIVNPDTVIAQMESGIAYGLSAALFGDVTIEEGRAMQSNFHDYKVVRMPDMPRVDTVLVPSGDAHGGVGEPGLPPIAPAVCNALLVLTGKPIRRLPIALG
jgi:isoquinoline 1-oxidoreductase beta subunit